MDNGRIYDEGTLGDFLKNVGIDGDPVSRLEHINEEPDVKELLASRIQDDIQQYLDDIADTWGGKAVVVKVKDDDAFVVWDEHWMPTIDFYKLVYVNNGTITPEDFKKYGESQGNHIQ